MSKLVHLALGALMLAAQAPTVHPDEPNGCEVIATGHPVTPGNCRYVAGGPGRFEVKTFSGYRIMATSDGGITWRTLASHTGLHDQPHTAIAVASGDLDTRAGDLVDVAIGHATMDTQEGMLRYQNGVIEAADRGDP